jgi:hypothetical protein
LAVKLEILKIFSRMAIQKCRKYFKILPGEDLPYCTTVFLMRHYRYVFMKLQTKKERQAGFTETAAEDIQLPATGYQLRWKLTPLALSPTLFLRLICESWVNYPVFPACLMNSSVSQTFYGTTTCPSFRISEKTREIIQSR